MKPAPCVACRHNTANVCVRYRVADKDYGNVQKHESGYAHRRQEEEALFTKQVSASRLSSLAPLEYPH
jgi:hypothetical protein